MRQFTVLVTSASLESTTQGDVSCGRSPPAEPPPVQRSPRVSCPGHLHPHQFPLLAPGAKTISKVGKMLSPWLQELTGSSCCGNGCNWPERGGHRIQDPRRRKSVQQHQPRPGRRSYGQAGEGTGVPGAGTGGGRYPMACPPQGTGMGPYWSMLPNLHSCLPCDPMRCPRSRGAAMGPQELISTPGSCSGRIRQ